MESLMEKLARMYHEKRQIGLLTWTYASVAVIVFVIAGIVALINQSAGVALLIVPLIAIAAMLANVIVWALIRFIIESHEQNEKSKARIEKQSSKSTKK